MTLLTRACIFQGDSPILLVTLDPAWNHSTVHRRLLELQLYPECRVLRANFVEFTEEDWAEVSRVCPKIGEIYNNRGSPFKARDMFKLLARFTALRKIRFALHTEWFREKGAWRDLLEAYDEVDFGYILSDFD